MRGPAWGMTIRQGIQHFPKFLLPAMVALLGASAVSAYGQQASDWTGRVSSNWFIPLNWDSGVPGQTTEATINTVTPNSTEITSSGAQAQNLSVGANRNGMLVVKGGGTLIVYGAATVGDLSSGVGTVKVTGQGSNWQNNGTMFIGGQGTSTFTVEEGGTVHSNGVSIGLNPGSNGTVTVAGPNSVWTNGPCCGVNIGAFGTGKLIIANGGKFINLGDAANIGQFAGSQGSVTVTGVGSTWSNLLPVNVGNSGTGSLTISDGGQVRASLVRVAVNAGSIGTLNIGSGAGSQAIAPGLLDTTSVVFGAGTGVLNFNHTSNTYVFAPAISGVGTVNALAGTTTLTGQNVYGGATNVSGGTLRAGALNAFSPNSAVTVGSGGTLDLAGFDQTIPKLINHGTVRTGGSPNTGPGTVLTVAGNYTAGSTLALNSVLAGDGSPSDLLRIDGGTATGRTTVIATDVGGGGAVTTRDGILVIDAVNGGTTAPTAFAGFGAAGPYDYLLVRGGAAPGSENDWFLRSSLDPESPGSPELPGASEPPVAREPRFRQEVSLYAAMPVMATIYGRKLIDTLHERMGGDAQLLGPNEPNMPDGAWGRIIGYGGHRDGDPVGIYGRNGPEYDYDFAALQTGLDLYRSEHADGQRDNAGLYFAIGHANADVEHNLLGRTFKAGEDKFDAVSVGGYWTRFGESGWYLDGVVQTTWYNMDMTAHRGLRDGDTNAFGFAASLEGGYPFQLGDGWQLEPQAQLVFQALNVDDFNDGAATVRYSDTNSLAGRIGARVTRDWEVGSEASERRFALWGRADLWHDFLGDPTTEFSSASGFIPFTADLGSEWATLGIGASMQIGKSTSLYGNVNYDVSFNGGADAWEGKVGLKIQW